MNNIYIKVTNNSDELDKKHRIILYHDKIFTVLNAIKNPYNSRQN